MTFSDSRTYIDHAEADAATAASSTDSTEGLSVECPENAEEARSSSASPGLLGVTFAVVEGVDREREESAAWELSSSSTESARSPRSPSRWVLVLVDITLGVDVRC